MQRFASAVACDSSSSPQAASPTDPHQGDGPHRHHTPHHRIPLVVNPADGAAHPPAIGPVACSAAASHRGIVHMG